MVFTPEPLPDLGGRVYLVTGGNAGIGFHTVLQLAAHHAKVYMGIRSKEKGRVAIEEIKVQLPNAEVYLLEMDMMNLQSVVSAAEEFCRRQEYLHGLVNNAGIMATPFEKTVDGYESQFQTNYLSHWLLTYRLLPTMLKTAARSSPGVVRIVNVASDAHGNAPSFGIDLQDIDQVNGGPVSRYGSSKLANILHTKELARRTSTPAARATNSGLPAENDAGGEIWVSSVHPGMVKTDLLSQANGSVAVRIMGTILAGITKTGLIGLTPENGACTQLFAVASESFTREMNGAYLTPIAKVGKPSRKAEDKQLATDLWKWSEREMKRKDFI